MRSNAQRLGDETEPDRPQAEHQVGRAGMSLRAVEEEGWSPELIEATVSGVSEKTLAVLRSLARRPGEWLAVDEIALGMADQDGRPPADSRSIGGVLGAFARRAKKSGMERVPFDTRFDSAAQRYQYRMDACVAALVAEVEANLPPQIS